MPISSLIVRCTRELIEGTRTAVRALEFVEITDEQDDTLVILTDTTSSDDDQITWDALNNLPGVIGTDIVYHNFEDTELSHAK